MRQVTVTAPPPPRGFLPFLVLTAVVCGALVMAIEVLGSRVIGPFFGVSLFVWTSLITVTLVALSGGYALGGAIADRRGTPDVLYALVLAAGLLVLAIPFARPLVLRSCVPLGLRAGALAASALLFGPALLLLGCVSPLLVKIAAREMGTIGRTVGSLYALSTLGSFVGTVVTGFVLVATFGVGRIFQGIGAVLVLLGASWFALFRRRLAPVALLVLALLSPAAQAVDKVLPDGTRLVELTRADGFYGSLRVVEQTDGRRHERRLLIDGLIQGGLHVESGLSTFGYAYSLQFLPWAMRPGGGTCLVVGVGAGLVPRWFEERGVRCDVVDIDRRVVDLATRFFGFRVSGEVVIDDARHFLATTDRVYDYVILDVFNGDTTPSHVLSREALVELARHVAPDGVLAANLIGSLVPGERLPMASVARTFRDAFPRVALFPVGQAAELGLGNVTVIAWKDASLRPVPARVEGFPVYGPLAAEIGRAGALFREVAIAAEEPALLLTDDYAPLDVLDREVKERLRDNVLAYTDWDVLL